MKKIINLYVRLIFTLGLAEAFFFAIYQLFLINRGLNLLQIGLVNLVFMICNFIFEVPTGAFADIYGRRRSTIIGGAILSLSYLIYFLSNGFWIFILAEVVGSLGVTFISGALEAWMIDSLKVYDYSQSQLEKVYRREGLFKTAGVMIGSLIGAYFGNINLALPWLLSAIGVAIFTLIVWFKLKENYPRPKIVEHNYKQIISKAREGIAYGLNHKGILYIIIFNTLLILSWQGLNMQWPILFKNHGLNVFQLGLIFNGIALFVLGGNLLAVKIKSLIEKSALNEEAKTAWEKKILILSQAVTAIGILIAALNFNLGLALGAFLIHEVGRGAFDPLKKAYLNRRITLDNSRATVLSFSSMVGQLGAGAGLIISGYLANSFSITVSWLFSAGLIIIAIPVFLKLKNGK